MKLEYYAAIVFYHLAWFVMWFPPMIFCPASATGLDHRYLKHLFPCLCRSWPNSNPLLPLHSKCCWLFNITPSTTTFFADTISSLPLLALDRQCGDVMGPRHPHYWASERRVRVGALLVRYGLPLRLSFSATVKPKLYNLTPVFATLFRVISLSLSTTTEWRHDELHPWPWWACRGLHNHPNLLHGLSYDYIKKSHIDSFYKNKHKQSFLFATEQKQMWLRSCSISRIDDWQHRLFRSHYAYIQHERHLW